MEGSDSKWWESNPISKIDLSENYLEDLPERLAVFGDVSVMNLMYNSFSKLPSVLLAFEKLRSLNLSKNKLTELPEHFAGAFPELKILNLGENQLHSLPSSFGALENLQEVYLNQNKLESIPESLCFIRTLTHLHASNNMITQIPEDIGQLNTLMVLDLSINKISKIGEGIKRLLRLQELRLNDNLLESVPFIPRSTQLHLLDVSINKLVSLHPDLFSNTPNIMTLFLRRNKLTDIDAINANYLPKLTTLDVADNNLSDLPNSLGHIDSLKHFTQDGNRIRCIRVNILKGPMSGLKNFLKERNVINIAHNQIADAIVAESDQINSHAFATAVANTANADQSLNQMVVRNVREAAASRKLILKDLPISKIPPTCAALSEIISADISNCPLVHLPDEAPGNEPLWPNLRALDASKTLCVNVPSVALTWRNLQSLSLERTKLASLFNPISLLQNTFNNCWPNLKVLNLNSNTLTSIPSELVFACPNLEQLSLNANRIKSWGPLQQITSADNVRHGFAPARPEAIFPCLQRLELDRNQLESAPTDLPFMLPVLHSLLIQNNEISVIPSSWGQSWPTLQVLTLEGNPQKTVRQHLLTKGTMAVKQFLANKDSARSSSKEEDINAEVSEGIFALGKRSMPLGPEGANYLRAAEEVLQHRQENNRPLVANEGILYSNAKEGARLIAERNLYPSGDPRLVQVPYFPKHSENEEMIKMAAKNAAASYHQNVQKQSFGSDALDVLIREENELLKAIEGVGLSSRALLEAKKKFAKVHAERIRRESEIGKGVVSNGADNYNNDTTYSIDNYNYNKAAAAPPSRQSSRGSTFANVVNRGFF